MIQYHCEYGDFTTEPTSNMQLPPGWYMVSVAITPPHPGENGLQVNPLMVTSPMQQQPGPIARTAHVCPNHTLEDIKASLSTGWEVPIKRSST